MDLLKRGWIMRIPWSELFRFGVMGVLSTVIYLVIMIPLKWVLMAQLWLVAVIAYLLSMTANYVLQRNVTFKSKRSHQEAVMRFLVVQLIGLAINAGLLDLLVTRQQRPFWLGQGIAVVITALWSYGAQKFWVFMKWGSPSVPAPK